MQRKNIALIAFTVLVLAAGILVYTSRMVSPKTSTMADVRKEAEIGGYRLITTAALWKRYRKDPKDLLIVDTRQAWEFRSGHIKGAANFPMEPTWWSRWRKKGALKQLLGSDKNRFIVFY